MGMVRVNLPEKVEVAMVRTQAECSYDERSMKMTIRHKGLTKSEQIGIQMWYGMNTPYDIEFVEVAE